MITFWGSNNLDYLPTRLSFGLMVTTLPLMQARTCQTCEKPLEGPPHVTIFITCEQNSLLWEGILFKAEFRGWSKGGDINLFLIYGVNCFMTLAPERIHVLTMTKFWIPKADELTRKSDHSCGFFNPCHPFLQYSLLWNQWDCINTSKH